MYKRTLLFEDTELYGRYNILPAVTSPADSVSFNEVGLVYVESWLGETVRTHDSGAAAYLDDARHWSGPSPYVTGVSGDYHFMRAPDVAQNPDTRIVSAVPLDSIGFFEKGRAETEKYNQYLPAVLEAALKPYNKDLVIIPSPSRDDLIGSLQGLESKAFHGSIYDFHSSRSLNNNNNTTGKFIMIVTLYNIMNRYWTAGSKAHHSLKLSLYIVDRASGQIVKVKFLELLPHLDMKPIESYPTAKEFRESKLFRFYLLASRELIARCFAETKGQ